jgi:hypothetical protein
VVLQAQEVTRVTKKYRFFSQANVFHPNHGRLVNHKWPTKDEQDFEYGG